MFFAGSSGPSAASFVGATNIEGAATKHGSAMLNIPISFIARCTTSVTVLCLVQINLIAHAGIVQTTFT
jgi:hypothetical protein